MGGRAVMNRNQGGYGYGVPQYAALGLALLLACCGSTTKTVARDDRRNYLC